MAKPPIPHDETDANCVGLTPPIGLEGFQSDVTNVFLHYVRSIGWMTDAETAWSLLKLPVCDATHRLFNPELYADDLGLTYEHIQSTEFARAMQRMYDYAYFGQLDLSAEELGYESVHTWITALVMDVTESAVAYEWDSYGLDILACSRRCAQVAETANARVILEGGEPLFLSFKGNGKHDGTEQGYLTVRQMSLLAGMEEMSIRAAANPSRANQLKPTKTDSGTRFEIDIAKDWLISKKRYIPVQKRWSEGELELATKRFTSLSELDLALNARFKTLCNKYGEEAIRAQFTTLGISTGNAYVGPYCSIEDKDFAQEEKMRGLAEVLGLPADLLVLRIKEVLAAEQLRAIERAIKELQGA